MVAPSFRILGGVSIQAATLVRAWHDDPQVDAWLVPIDPLPPAPFRRLIAIKYVRTITTELVYIPQLIRQLARADVVHVFSAAYSSFLLAALPAILVARMLGKPVILNYHSGEAPNHLRRSKLARAVLAQVHRIVVQSPYLQRVFDAFGLDTLIVPNTIEFDRFRFRARCAFAPRLLTTRNFQRRYNVACTIRAFRVVKDRYPGATLTIAGFGPQEVALRELVASLRLSDVTFLGRVAPDDMGQHYEAADVFVQTPEVDNMPLSVLQAFAAGLPVVSTAAGGVPTILRNERDGLLAPANDHDAVAAQIFRILANQSFASGLVESAYETCGQYAWRFVRGQWLDAYNSLLAAPHTLRPESARSPRPIPEIAMPLMAHDAGTPLPNQSAAENCLSS